MTKAELIRYLDSYCHADEQQEIAEKRVRDIEKEIADCEKPPVEEKPKSILAVLLISLVFAAVALTIGSLVLNIYADWHNKILGFSRKGYYWGEAFWFMDYRDSLFGKPHGLLPSLLINFLTGAIYMIPVAAIVFLITICVYVRRNTAIPEKNKKIAENYEQRLAKAARLKEELKTRQRELANAKREYRRLGNMDILPETYRSIHYAEKYLELLKDGRADTLKEAINLHEQIVDWEDMQYHMEQQHQEMMSAVDDHMSAIQAEASRAADAAEEAADKAGDAAFWNAASTFIVASEIDRQRKDNS